MVFLAATVADYEVRSLVAEKHLPQWQQRKQIREKNTQQMVTVGVGQLDQNDGGGREGDVRGTVS